MQPLRHITQINRDYCGPAVLQIVLEAFGIERTQLALAKEAHTPTDPDHGTETKDMVAVLRAYQLEVEEGNNKTISDIRRALDAGSVVIICYTEMYDNLGHYSIVFGFTDSEIRLLDPAEKLGTILDIPIETFEERWQDPLFTKSDHWAAFVSPPSKK